MSGEKARTAEPEKRFVDMTGSEKLVFMGKALVFFVSGGFIYPTLWVD